MSSLIILLYAIIEPLVVAKVNSHYLAEIHLMYTFPGRESERKQEHKSWHFWQAMKRGIVFAFVVYALAGVSWEAVGLAALGAPVLYMFFNRSLNLFRGLGFFHKGKNDLDNVYRFDFMAFLFEVFLVLCGCGVWYVLIIMP